MRLKLSLEINTKQDILPLNYQYEVMAWIYKLLQTSDPAFSQWLHQHGYTLDYRNFKGFVFSDLYIYPRWERRGDRLKILSRRAQLVISFYMDAAVEHFIIGLFQNQRLVIADHKSRAEFDVQTVERLPDPDFLPQMTFQTLSPICIARTVPGQKHAEYMDPQDPEYATYFFNNLLNKYRAFTRQEIDPDELRRQTEERQPLTFSLTGEPKSRLIKIKADKPEETRVRGYHYTFTICAPPELLAMGYHAGFGEKNATGFGCVAVG